MSYVRFADASLDAIPDCSDAQWDAARTFLAKHAPDLYECVTGEPSTADVLAGLHATRETDQRVRLERGLRGAK